MNTYNENLNTTVVNSLYNQEIALLNIQAITTASKFTLYYAEGATITADEKLDLASGQLEEKGKVQTQAVDCSNASNNQLKSANQANTYIQQSVTNTAVAAANVQTATNAIVKLAGDIGNAFSIVNAADFGTDIYDQTVEAKELINITAYQAERASQIAMEASASTAGVSISAVADKSTSTNASMNDLLAVAKSDFDTTSELVSTDTEAVASASADEKSAEGDFLDNLVEDIATQDAYNTMNDELNLALEADVAGPKSSPTGIHISFDQITNPFKLRFEQPYYPVSEYYAIFVKNDRKSIFSLTNADTMLQQDSPALYQVGLPEPETLRKVSKGVSKGTANLDDSEPMENLTPAKIEHTFDLYEDGEIDLIDSDGDALEFGTQYTVFILAVYVEDYKWKINNYDNFLTAPSAPFELLFELVPVDNGSINVTPYTEATVTTEDAYIDVDPNEVDAGVSIAVDTYTPLSDDEPDPEYRVTFDAALMPTPTNDGFFKVDYRCMFLLHDTRVNGKFMADHAQQRMVELEKISVQYDTEIDSIQLQINSYRDGMDGAKKSSKKLGQEIKNVQKEIDNSQDDPEHLAVLEAKKSQLQSDKADSDNDASYYSDQINVLKPKLTDLQNEKQALVDKFNKGENHAPDFIFDAEIAEQVPDGNFLPATQADGAGLEVHLEKLKKGIDIDVELMIPYQAYINASTTDNFGNQLMEGKWYIPVILGVSAQEEEDTYTPEMFESTLSNFRFMEPFQYIPSDLN